MTPQVIVGLLLLLVGVAVKVLAAIKQLPDIALVGELTNLGMLLLGKELMQASPAAQAKRSSLPPKAGAVGVVLALLLVGCAGAEPALQADDYAQRLNKASVALLRATPIIDAGCAFLEERSPCPVVRQAHATAVASEAVARHAIQVYAQSGEGLLAVIGNVIAAEADAAALALEAGKLAQVIRDEAKAAAAPPPTVPAEGS